MSNRVLSLLAVAAVACVVGTVRGEIPSPTNAYVNWTMPWGEEVPGAMAANSLLHTPAGKFGHVTVRGDHFYVGEQRIRFWGVNLCLSACFPTHEMADLAAQRMSRFGINSVRLHHMDARKAPEGIFADDKLDTLSPEQMDRLDYFVAALKRHGIYTNINLKVSRPSANVIYPGAEKYNRQNKFIDLFDPKLIAADKKFFRDLLTHVNAYTGMSYAEDPAVCTVEINNENNCFSWSSWGLLADKRPEPFMSELGRMWNDWLVRKYGSRERLEAAWSPGPLTSPNLLKGDWRTLEVAGTQQRGIELSRWYPYTLSFRARAEKPLQLGVHVSLPEEIEKGRGLHSKANVGTEFTEYSFSFMPGADGNDFWLTVLPGVEGVKVELADVKIQLGGREGLRATEDAAANNVAMGAPRLPFTQSRYADWYDFLHSVDQGYYVEMKRYLKEELGVKAPVTGTYACSPLGTLSQTQMDYVDAHGYWDSPRFRGAAFGSAWYLNNTPMVDDTRDSEIFKVACHRIAGKPFTLSEYNHAHPNDWQAECLPILASYAAMQDWDAVWVFAYTHDRDFKKPKIISYFNIEGNPVKMNLMPAAARIFLNQQIKPLAGEKVVYLDKQDILDNILTYWHDLEPYVKDRMGTVSNDTVVGRLAVTFDRAAVPEKPVGPIPDPRYSWTSEGANTGTGQYVLRDPYASVFAGFRREDQPIDVGFLRIEELISPFATFVLTPADPTQPLARADRMLLVAAAREQNSNMEWDAERTTTISRPGDAPPQIEIVKATLSIEGGTPVRIFALNPDGTRGAELSARGVRGRQFFEIGQESTMWYELVR